jgi:hypothetical protein
MVDDICLRNSIGSYYLLNRVNSSGITGCIYDSLTGEPLQAEVVINSYYDPTLPPRMSDPTYGRFLRILGYGTYDIEIHKNGYQSFHLSGVVVEPGEMLELNVHLKKKEANSMIPADTPNLMIFPNPTRNVITICVANPDKFSSVKIYDISGRVLKDFENPSSNTLIWLGKDNMDRDLANGVYYVIGETNDAKLVRKIVINN